MSIDPNDEAEPQVLSRSFTPTGGETPIMVTEEHLK